jgi:dTDP-glucose 4,6-dehydratase
MNALQGDALSSTASVENLFLTGATGFFGRSLLRWTAQRQESNPGRLVVTALARQPDRFLRSYPEFIGLKWLAFHQGDITRPESLPAGPFSQVLHAAADSTAGHLLRPLDRFDQVLAGTRNLLDFAVRAGARRFLLTSSGAVYGTQVQRADGVPESSCSAPDPADLGNAYGIAKYAAEHLCALYHRQHGLETVIARCFAFVGPDLPLDAHFAIGNFIRDALAAPEIIVQGSGTALRSYLYQDDLAEWLMCILQQGTAGRSYNVGSDQPLSIAELADLVRSVLAPHKAVRVLGTPSAEGTRSCYVPDIRRAKSELGLSVRIPLSEAIARSGRLVSLRSKQFSLP